MKKGSRIGLAGLGLALLGQLAGAEATHSDKSTLERDGTLGVFLEEHWRLPVRAQGQPPEAFQSAESSLDPRVCGACHPKQWQEWQGSLHAGAYSPGFSGQLIEGDLAEPAEVRNCQTCHAPLAEQQPQTAEGLANPAFDPALRQQGIVCASCHVRAHRRFGPPRREGIPAPEGPVAHGGFEARKEFQQARFCAPCHQFFDDEGVNGKPLENTFAEWQASPHAAEGRTCQSCHMPDRAHRWRGIHDPEMVRNAVDVTLTLSEASGDSLLRAALAVSARDVGHHFPSYVTPRVFVSLFQVDASGTELRGTRLESVIAREVDLSLSPWEERFDTRIPAGGVTRMDYAEPRHERATALVGRVRVDPDFHYRGVYEYLLSTLSDPGARAKIEAAVAGVADSSYLLAERRQELP